jgi:hypothetical protein
MNYNVLTYILYLAIILYVVIYVGAMLYRNGIHFLINTFHGDKILATALNKFLLAGYYLLNIGYSIIVLKIWQKVDSFQSMVEVLSFKAGGIILMLGAVHLFNLLCCVFIGKIKNNKKINHSTNN